MTLAHWKVPAALALVCGAFFVTFLQVKANEETDDPVSEAAVWTPDADDLPEIAQSCPAAETPAYNKCFVDQMGSYASSEAVAFSQALLDGKGSRAGYLSGLHEAGPVDLGFVDYPGTSGLNQGWVLVNGAPAIVNVDDLSLLPQSAMEKDAQFKALREQHPQLRLAVDNNERGRDTVPEMLALGNGDQRFVIDYSLKELCSDCKPAAHASFGFDFDAAGKFLGVRFIKVTPSAPQQ